ncbi:MAG: DUF1326 domain-containing protein [Burkholderiales bacterium]|nr:DUF1326 domain-containing protein [Burkholderiales bacterium]
MADAWWLKGEYLENCNCEVLCPCLLGPRNARGGAMARPTEGHCDVPLVFRIDAGAAGSIALGGTHVALAAYTPGAMGEGNWRVALYLDAAASDAQRAALERIFSGRSGGVMARIAATVGEWLPARVVPIEFGIDGRRRWARIPGVLDVEIEGIQGATPEGASWIDNVRHFVSRRLAAARASRGTYEDHGWHWNNAGRNGHYAAFDWQGP